MNFVYKTIILTLCVLAIFAPATYAEEDKNILLFVINEVNFNDLHSMPSVKQLISEGAIGLMNNRTSTRPNSYKAFATIGAGTRAEAFSDSSNFSMVDPEAQLIYGRRTGNPIPGTGIINLDIPKLHRLNEAGEYGAIPGALGQALHDKGLKTAVIGNSDTSETSIRLSGLIAMDMKGYIDAGDISKNILMEDEVYPFGLKTNYPKMLELFKTLYKSTSLVVMELGDIGRLERYKDNMSSEHYENMKKKILEDADTFISTVLEEINLEQTRILLVTPYSSSKDIIEGRRLTPIVFFGAGVTPGLVYSDTTRREGIVGNIDIGPSVIEFLNSESPHMLGKPIHFIPKEDNYIYILNLEKQVVHTSNNRYPVLSSFAIFEIIVSISALLLLLFQKRFHEKFISKFKNILLSTMIVPFVLLVIPLFNTGNLIWTYLTIIIATGILTFIVQRFFKEIDAIIILSGITTFAILLDLINNGFLIKTSLLGYDPIIGARYYGIGNEYMGVLIGSTLVFATALLDRFNISRSISIVIFLVTVGIIAFPKLGANVGGTITAVFAFTFTALRLFKFRISLKHFIIIGLLVFTVVAMMAIIDIKFIDGQSHLAGAIEQIAYGGPKTLFMIVNRKVSMNLRLIGVTIWSKVLLTTIIILAIMFYRPVKMIYRLSKTFPNLSIGWAGIITACIVGFVVNDSGIVAAATGIIFLAMSMLYLSFNISKEID